MEKKTKVITAHILDNNEGRVFNDYFLTYEAAEQFCTNHGLVLMKTATEYVDFEIPQPAPCPTMTSRQKELIRQLAQTYADLADECQNDNGFHEVIIKNNDLFPQSLDEMAAEWFAVANWERGEYGTKAEE